MNSVGFASPHLLTQTPTSPILSFCPRWRRLHNIPFQSRPNNVASIFTHMSGSPSDDNSTSKSGTLNSAASSTPTPASSNNTDETPPEETNDGNSGVPGRGDELLYQVSTLRSVTALSREEWDNCATGGCASPFLRYDWIYCLEQSGCASLDMGWTPSHIVLRNKKTDKILAIAPAYLKFHSLGEFVFDQDWADAAYAAGINYYPKLLLAVPFTPATGRRILTSPGVSSALRAEILSLFSDVLVQLCSALGISSVHVNFCSEDEAAALSSKRFLLRKGVQFHFTNYRKGQAAISAFEDRLSHPNFDPTVHNFDLNGTVPRQPYSDFEDYLSEFKSKKRIKMRRERQVVREESGLQIEVVRGEEIDNDLFNEMFDIYKSTIDKKFYGRQYLNRKFFNMLHEAPAEFRQHICLVLARAVSDGRLVGGTFNVIGGGNGGAFYGRYWGCMEEFRYLHFEACYYTAIEYCIKHGLSRMEPGAGGGDFKYMRGFEPAITLSMHYLHDKRLSDAVARYLQIESLHIESAVSDMHDESAIRSKRSAT